MRTDRIDRAVSRSPRSALSIAAVLFGVAAISCQKPPGGEAKAPGPASGDSPEFVGREACARCHQVETERWELSHHDLAG